MALATISKDYIIRYGEKIGNGAFGCVYKGLRKRDKLPVAIKLIEKKKLSSNTIRCVAVEVSVLERLNHPNIVKFHDMYEDYHAFYVCLEYVPGGELLDRITKKSVYTENQARDVCKVILGALKHVHDHNIVHRDVKPQNLIMQNQIDDTAVTLIDFGFAAEAPEPTLTGLIGTSIYMAPEIYNRRPYGKPVDMWAFGVVVFILLSGYAPFSDENQDELVESVTTASISFDATYWTCTSPEAKDFISQLLTVDPISRLTVDQALRHPWLNVEPERLLSRNLSRNLAKLSEFNARKKLKAFMKAVLVTRMLDKQRTVMPASLPPPVDPEPLSQLVRRCSLRSSMILNSGFSNLSEIVMDLKVPAPAEVDGALAQADNESLVVQLIGLNRELEAIQREMEKVRTNLLSSSMQGSDFGQHALSEAMVTVGLIESLIMRHKETAAANLALIQRFSVSF